MTGKSKAIFRLQKPKVTYPAKKQSDIPAPQAQGHLCLRDSKAIFRLRKDKVTHLEVCLLFQEKNPAEAGFFLIVSEPLLA